MVIVRTISVSDNSVILNLVCPVSDLRVVLLVIRDKAAFSKGANMVKKTVKKLVRRPWTTQDHRLMKTMAKAKAGQAKIAKALKRTPGAVNVMATKVGVSLSMR